MATLDLGNLIAHLRLDGTQFTKMLDTATKKLQHSAEKMERMGRSMTMRVTLPILGVGAAAVKGFASFNDAMTKSAAIMSDVNESMRAEMEETALTISKNSVTSATELARSYFFLASAGLSAEQSVAALATVEKFAVAGAFDMALATDLLTDAQSALGMKVDDATQNMRNMQKVSDVLTGANTLANASTLQFSKALTSQAGPAMKAYGIALEEGVAVLAAYADQGIKAEEAGNMLSRMLRLMTKGFLDNRAAWKRLEIGIFDGMGALKPMHQIIRELSFSLKYMSTEQKIATLNMLGFQARSQQAILPLLGLGDAIESYQEKLEEMQGITKEIADKQLKSFSSQLKILWNQIKAVSIEIGSILAPKILALNEHIKKAIKWWEDLSKTTKDFIVDMTLVVAVIGPALWLTGKLTLGVLALSKALMMSTASAGLLSIALSGAFVAIAGWNLGGYLQENFKWVAEAGIKAAAVIMDAWTGVKVVFIYVVGGLKNAWLGFVAWLKNTTGDALISISNMLKSAGDKLGKDLGHGPILIMAHTLKQEAASMRSGIEDSIAEISATIDALDKEGQKYLDAAAEGLKELDKKFSDTAKSGTESIDDLTERLEKLKGELENMVDKEPSDKLVTRMESLNTWLTNVQDGWARVSDIAVSAMDGMADALATMAETGKADFKALAVSVLQDLNRMITRMMLAKALEAGMGLFSAPGSAGTPGTEMSGSTFSNYSGYAMGAMFNLGKVIPMANGFVTDGPTMAPMALMGEAGPEAVMPLSRGTDGKLGIKSQQSQSNINFNPQIKIIEVRNEREAQLETMRSAAGEKIIVQKVSRNRRSLG